MLFTWKTRIYKPECLKRKKLPINRNKKTQLKINLINEYQLDSEDEKLISELDFEIDNSSIYILKSEADNQETIYMVLEQEQNQPQKEMIINQEKLIKPLKSKLNPNNFWKDLHVGHMKFSLDHHVRIQNIIIKRI